MRLILLRRCRNCLRNEVKYMFNGWFKNRKEFIIYVIILAVSLTVCIFLLLKTIEYFEWANYYRLEYSKNKDEYSYRDMSYTLKLGMLLLISFLLILFLNVYHLLKIRGERLPEEKKAELAAIAAEKKRLKLEEKAQSLQNEIDKLDDGDKQ